jgi:ribosome-associated translation inhibitor RaiA
MIDEEVETVLREIRERVISQPIAGPTSSGSSPGANGNQNSQLVATAETSVRSSEATARLNAHLTTTARAWDRLPPVFSNRRGTAARIEVWIKARIKVLSRWFTWEQVNFNAAVHHALGETLKALTEQAAEQAAAHAAANRSQLAANEALRVEIQALRDEIDTLRAQLQADAANRKIDLQNRQSETNAFRAEIRGEMESVRIQSQDRGAELRTRIEAELAKLLTELRERQDRLENEQRVYFKQLSLETNEMAVSSDRAQQRSHLLLEEMNQRIKQLEDPENRKPGP